MALSIVPAKSADVAEVSVTSGTGPYKLGGAIVDHWRFVDAVDDGVTVLYKAEADSDAESGYAVFTAPDTLAPTGTFLLTSNNNMKVDWPARGQRIIRLLTSGADDTADMQNITSGLTA